MKDVFELSGIVRGPRRLFGALAVAIAWSVAVPAASPALAQPEIIVLSDESKHAGEFIIPVNKSQVLRVDQPLKDLLVGNAEIADVLALTDRSVYVLGKSLGSTSLTLYGQDKQLIAVMDLVVAPDIEGLKARYFEIMPKERVEVRPVNNGIMLTGTLSDATKVSSALAIADRYAGGGNVTNLLAVQGSQQVMLEVRFSEVSRSAGKALGLNFDAGGRQVRFTSGDAFLNSGTEAIDDGNVLLNPAAFAAGAASWDIGSAFFNLLYETLEGKGVIKTLAEPNLIALSGDTATFLAGGEFPVPVEQDDSITIEFKEFGISLGFTPTVLSDDLVNLVLTTEVSTIDTALTVQTSLSGGGVPGLATNRATTTVELRDGQSFAIAGLLQDDFRDQVNQYPFLGDVPILGALFRSSEYQRSESELVVTVTLRMVQPTAAGTLITPADRFVPPSDIDIFLFGRVESPESGLVPGAGAGHEVTGEAGAEEKEGVAELGSGPGLVLDDKGLLASQSAGGVAATYGHIIK